MNHLFVSYERAKSLKELDFDEPCFGYYEPYLKGEDPIFYLIGDIGYRSITNKHFIKAKANGSCLAPTHQQIVDWFREKHDLTIYAYNGYSPKGKWIGTIIIKSARLHFSYADDYYAALNAAIDEAIKLIKI